MAVYVETDFALALAKDSDRLQARAVRALDEFDVETSVITYLELVLARRRHEFDYPQLVANLLELVPVQDEAEKQIVLKGTKYFEAGLTPFDAFHAAAAETRRLSMLSSDATYDEIGVDRLPVEPEGSE